MIDISFLRSPKPPVLRMGGMEFMDWQENTTFYEDLIQALNNSFVPADGCFNFSKGDRETRKICINITLFS